jgi:ankyrin repeat protein
MGNEVYATAQLAYTGKLTVQDVQAASDNDLDQEFDYCSVLYCACQHCPIEVVQALLDRNVNINELSTESKTTPLMGAIMVREWDVATLLLNRGANVSCQDKYGWNILHYAAEHDPPNELIYALIDAGADPMAKSSRGEAPVDIARREGNDSLVKLFEDIMNRSMKVANFIA